MKQSFKIKNSPYFGLFTAFPDSYSAYELSNFSIILDFSSGNKFVGCMKNVNINGFSVLNSLYKNSGKTSYHGATMAKWVETCPDGMSVPLTLPFSSSYFWSPMRNATQEFTIRMRIGWISFGTVMYMPTSVGEGHGYFEVRKHSTRSGTPRS